MAEDRLRWQWLSNAGTPYSVPCVLPCACQAGAAAVTPVVVIIVMLCDPALQVYLRL
jgi:hypothetical protein